MKIRNLSRNASPAEIVNSIDQINTYLNNFTLTSNAAAEVVHIEGNIDTFKDIEIRHNLKVTPKYRIILREETTAFVMLKDGDTQWNETSVTFQLIASAVTTIKYKATILLIKE